MLQKEAEINSHNAKLAQFIKASGNGGQEQTENSQAKQTIAKNFQKIIATNSEILDRNKMSLIINDGKGKQTINIPYKKDVYDKIQHIRETCQTEIAMNKNALFQDQFGNILLDNLDIIDSLYPFYNFQVKNMGPQISIIHP